MRTFVRVILVVLTITNVIVAITGIMWALSLPSPSERCVCQCEDIEP